MKNTDDVSFWLFGNRNISKLAMLAATFITGVVVGLLLRKTKQSVPVYPDIEEEDEDIEDDEPRENRSRLSDEDRDYIS